VHLGLLPKVLCQSHAGRCSYTDTAVLGHTVILAQLLFAVATKKQILELQLQDLVLWKSVSVGYCTERNVGALKSSWSWCGEKKEAGYPVVPIVLGGVDVAVSSYC